MSEIRWRGMTHHEIYDAVWTGPGPDGSTEPEKLWTFVNEVLSDAADTLTRGVSQARNGWTGTAAENAAASIRSLALRASEAAAGASRLKGAVIAQGEYVAHVRNTLPPPVPSAADAISALGGFSILAVGMLDDLQLIEQAHTERAQQAVHVMETYESNTEVNKPYIQSFAAPAAVTTGGGLGGISSVFGAIRNTAGRLAASAAGAIAAGAAVSTGGSAVAIGAAGGVAAAGLPIAVGGGAGISPAAAGAAGSLRPGIGTAPGLVPTPVVPPGAVATPAGSRPGTGPGAIRTPQTPGTAGLPAESTPISGRAGIGGIRPGGIGGSSSLPRGIPGGFGGVEPTTPRGLPGGIGAGEAGVGRGAVSPTTAAGGASGAQAGSHGFFPPGAGGAGGQSREHRRPSYLVDDTDAFGDDRYFTPQIITPDDYIPRRA